MLCGVVRRRLKFATSSSVQARACSTSSLASSLRLSAHENALLDGRRAHTAVVCLGLEQTKLLANLLVQMYGRCERLEEASFIFQNLRKRDCFSWNFIINAYARCGRFHDVLQLFADMYKEGIIPDKYVFASTISLCAEEADSLTAMHIHFLIILEGQEFDTPLQNAILNVYAKCDCLDDARAVFLSIEHKDESSYNSILSGYVSSGQSHKAMVSFSQMMEEGLMPNKVTFIAVVCACVEDVHKEGQHLHARLVLGEYKSSIVLTNALIGMYGKAGDLKGAANVFDSLLLRNLVSWNCLIGLHAQHGEGRKSYKLFNRLHQEGALPNGVTFRSLSPGFESLDLRDCKRLHIQVLHDGCGADDDATLINMYSKCGSCTDAFQLFDVMPMRNLKAWNALAAGDFHHYAGECTWQFSQMFQEGVLPDKVTFLNAIAGYADRIALAEGIRLHALLASSCMDVVLSSALLNMYGKCGSLESASALFSTMSEKNEYSWASMIAAYATRGDIQNSLVLFERMQWEDFKADKVSILCLLYACANQTSLNFCKYVHTLVVETGFHKYTAVQNSLLTMYSKCGSLIGANKLFKKMNEKNLISWTALISASAHHGLGKEAFLFFQEMKNAGVCPDQVTFVEVLSACSRAGFVDDACYILASMKQHHGMEPTVDHVNCMIDLFGRAGRLDVAQHLILSMSEEPSTVSWLTLLGACINHLDLKRGEHAAKWVCHPSLKDASPYVALSNLYASFGRFDNIEYIKHEMCLLHK